MMYPVIFVFLSISIGAGIGALTNSIAILMLFRPYKRIKIPFTNRYWWFTPGLIPRRQEEIAEQLGEIVEHKLLKLTTLEREINQRYSVELLDRKINNKIEEWIEQKESIYSLLAKKVEQEELDSKLDQLEQTLLHLAHQELDKLFEVYKDKRVEEVFQQLGMPEAHIIKRLKELILHSLKAYMGSRKGQEKLEELLNSLLNERGGIGSFIQAFTPVTLISTRLAHFLRDCLEKETVEQAIELQLQQTLAEWKHKTIAEAIHMLTGSTELKTMKIMLLIEVSKKIDLHKLSKKPLGDWLSNDYLKHYPNLITLLCEKIGFYLPELTKSFIQKLSIAKIVAREVNQYPIQELEQVIRSLAKRELKLITMLGGMIGALIGLLQALVYLVLT